MKTLYAFIDESGTYKPSDSNNKIVNDRFYLISMVFYEDNENIVPCINKLNNHLSKCGIPENKKVHCMPLVNRDTDYDKGFKIAEVEKIFLSMSIYTKCAPLHHITILMDAIKNKENFNDYFVENL